MYVYTHSSFYSHRLIKGFKFLQKGIRDEFQLSLSRGEVGCFPKKVAGRGCQLG